MPLADGTMVSERSLKAGILWTSFKERLSVSKCHRMLIDLPTLINQVDPPVLDEPFSKEENYQAVKDMHAL